MIHNDRYYHKGDKYGEKAVFIYIERGHTSYLLRVTNDPTDEPKNFSKLYFFEPTEWETYDEHYERILK
jgi:hypothetical protein